MKNIFVFALSIVLCSITGYAKEPVKVLIVTGQSNHNWEASSVILQKYLNESGLFVADMAVSPKKSEDMSKFQPDFSAYKAVILDYNGDSWPAATNSAFLQYVEKGGGVVVYHAADNAFSRWKEYNEIIGLGGWEGRNEKDGPYVYFRDGKEVRDDTPGRGGSHGKQHEYVVTVRDKKHPITKGLPASWTHARDELYDRLRGPARNMTILATAFSDESTGGTGRDEPALMVVSWGKGRIFHTILGHVGNEAEHPAVECPDFIVTFLRGVEWAATGKVTQKVPDDFPGK
ncbi:MAG: ThuA domain-containing protein [Bacteroidales bacterium]|jgi:type 1 glutamine amidotransferase|nr:ThuA domain-containing protein [Bacteroidales bacterium]